jgi:ubiquinone/menaquinone biosynthesis C-methylase UbiE
MSDSSPKEESPRFGFPRETITESASDGGLGSYEHDLGFNRHDLEGKKVMDLGTGQSDRLARDLKDAEINAVVIGVSPDLQRDSNRRLVNYYAPGWQRKAVAAIAQQLPFTDESFDVVLAAYSVINYASNSPRDVEAWVSEVARVLKLGGEARLGPTYGGRSTFGENFQDLIETAKKYGLDFTTYPHTKEYGSHMVLKKVSESTERFNPPPRKRFKRQSSKDLG